MDRLNFSWVIPNKIAGCEGPSDESDLVFLKEKGITLLVRLAEKERAKVTSKQVARVGLKDFHEPVGDFHAPSQEQIDNIVKAVRQSLEEGSGVAISCGAGRGRTGTLLSCILISLGYDLDEAITKVQETRRQSRAWETVGQYEAIVEFAGRLAQS